MVLDALECFESPGADRFGDGLVVALALVGVPFGEVGDGFVELVLVAEVGGARAASC